MSRRSYTDTGASRTFPYNALAMSGTTVAFALDRCPPSAISGDCGPTWTADVGSNAGMPVSLSSTQVAVGLANGNVAVLDATTGTLQWTAVTGSTNATAPAVTSTTMYVGMQDGSVRGRGLPLPRDRGDGNRTRSCDVPRLSRAAGC